MTITHLEISNFKRIRVVNMDAVGSVTVAGRNGQGKSSILDAIAVLLLGGAPAMLVTCQDLSDIQHVQTMLQGMSSLLRQIVDGAPVASFVIDRHHRVTHWNTACSRLTGQGADSMIGSTEPWRTKSIYHPSRMTPCESWPAKLELTRMAVTASAIGRGVPAATKSSRVSACKWGARK